MNVSRETMLKQRDLTRTLKVPQPWWVCEGVPGRLPCPASRASACCRAARAPSRAARQTPFSSTYSCVIDPAARVSARAGLGSGGWSLTLHARSAGLRARSFPWARRQGLSWEKSQSRELRRPDLYCNPSAAFSAPRASAP